jgi:hypothetical protein
VRIVVLLILLICSNADSQMFYFGVKGGTPLSPSTSSAFDGDRSGSGLSALNIRRYTVGPTFEVALPFRLHFEADALYKRLDRTEHRFLGSSFGNINRNAADAWEFPLLLKYPLLRNGRLSPFVAGGGTFRRIQSFEGSTETFAYGLQPPYSVIRYRINDPLTQGGIVFGVGVRFTTVGPLKVTPEIRFTRWRSMEFLPTKNQVEIFVGLGL